MIRQKKYGVVRKQEEEIAPPTQLLEVRQVAELLQISRSKVFQLMRKEGLPFIKWDRTLRFDVSAVARWLAAQHQSV